MTSLEEEFKNLLGNRYHIYTHVETYEGPSIEESNKVENFDELFEHSPNDFSNNESVKRVKDIVNKDRFALDILILDIIKEFEYKSYNDKKIKFEYYRANPNQEYILYGDKNRIGQVIFNLISNSIKFILRDGKIIIIIEKAKSNYKNKTIIVTIKDTGIGIDDEIYPNLFTKFVTKSFQGTGLGLYISKNIIEAHGGKIWGENNKDGKGATFGFRLPIKNRPIN